MASKIHGFRDLVSTAAQFVNRQRSSGTRVLFDKLLATDGIYPDQIVGYNDTELSGEKVAEAVHARRAQVGFGLRTNAETLGLKFVPLTQEAYYLALRRSDQSAPWLQTLLGVTNPTFTRRVQALPGYQPAERQGILLPQEVLPWYGPDGQEGS